MITLNHTTVAEYTRQQPDVFPGSSQPAKNERKNVGNPRQIERFEVLLIKAASRFFAFRTAQVLRLIGANNLELSGPEETEFHPALLGRMGFNRLAIFDLARLLELEPDMVSPSENNAQIIMVEYNNRVIGLRVTATYEVSRVALEALAPLPELIEANRTRPVAWALWQRAEGEPVILLDSAALLSEAEWELYSTVL